MIYAFPTFHGGVGEALGAYGRGVGTVLDPDYDALPVLDTIARPVNLLGSCGPRRPLSNSCHAPRRPGIATRCVLGSAITSPVVAKPASLRLARLAADLHNSITQQTS
jgi:hypothetical protein